MKILDYTSACILFLLGCTHAAVTFFVFKALAVGAVWFFLWRAGPHLWCPVQLGADPPAGRPSGGRLVRDRQPDDGGGVRGRTAVDHAQ